MWIDPSVGRQYQSPSEHPWFSLPFQRAWRKNKTKKNKKTEQKTTNIQYISGFQFQSTENRSNSDLWNKANMTFWIKIRLIGLKSFESLFSTNQTQFFDSQMKNLYFLGGSFSLPLVLYSLVSNWFISKCYEKSQKS